MFRLTVIVPFLKTDSTEQLEETLASVLENRSEFIDICVINNGQYNDSYDIGQEGVRFVHAESDSLIDCINQGIRCTDAEIVHPILCGAVVKNDWTKDVLKRFDDSDISVVIPIVWEGAATSSLSGSKNQEIEINHAIQSQTGLTPELSEVEPQDSGNSDLMVSADSLQSLGAPTDFPVSLPESVEPIKPLESTDLEDSADSLKSTEPLESSVEPSVMPADFSKTPSKAIHAGYVYRRNGKIFSLSRHSDTLPWDRVAPHVGGAFFRRSTLLELNGLSTDFSKQVIAVSPKKEAGEVSSIKNELSLAESQAVDELENVQKSSAFDSSLQLSYLDMVLLMSSLGERSVWETRSIIYYPWGTFQREKELNPRQWRVFQEVFFSRWRDWGGLWGAKWQHRFRLALEVLGGLFRGGLFDILKDYRLGKRNSSFAKRRELISLVQEERQLERQMFQEQS